MAAARKPPWQVEKLRAERDRIMDQIEELEKEVAGLWGRRQGLQSAIDILLNGTPPPAEEESAKSARGEAKILLLALLEEVGANGLNAAIAEDMARKRGAILKRGTAASNLSRLKADNVITYDGDRYRLPKFARQPGLVVLSGTHS